MNRSLPSAFPPQLRRELAAWPRIDPIPADGSVRCFFRLRRGDLSCICLYHPQPPGRVVTENDSYFWIGQHLQRQGLPVPAIIRYCREEGWLLVEDLGTRFLQEEYQDLATWEEKRALYRRVLNLLIDLQLAGSRGFQASWCFDTPVYDAPFAFTRECLYFQQAFLQGYLGWGSLPDTLQHDFTYLVQQATAPPEQVVIHRDFQSRNLLVHGNRLGFIDFQGARWGPPQYDLAALLLDPYVQLPFALQEQLLEEFLVLLGNYASFDSVAWRRRYSYVALCRNLQILGAYGFLTVQKGKPFFQAFIPPACRSLGLLLRKLPPAELPTLRWVAHQALTQVKPASGASSA